MADIPIEQAIYGNAGGYRFLARSSGFLDDWLAAAEQLCTGFGDRPADVACPHAVFAQPLGPDHVAVVQVADQGADDAGRPGALGFHLLVLPRKVYVPFVGDPFYIAERFPPNWVAREYLPTLTLSEGPPRRTVDQVQRILKSEDSATLFGGTQALVDGVRLVCERPAPATSLLRDLWALLPNSTRSNLWPASFAFGNRLGFDVVVLPRIEHGECEGYLTEKQAGDYPPGRYELAVQTAAESGDQAGLEGLFARRSSADTLRLALVLVVLLSVAAVVMNYLNRDLPPKQPARPFTTPPLPTEYTSMKQADRKEVGAILRGLADDLRVTLPSANPVIADLLGALDKHLGTPDPERDCGPIAAIRPEEKQLRALMWKHHIDGFDDVRLNPVELAQRLRQKLTAAKPGGTAP